MHPDPIIDGRYRIEMLIGQGGTGRVYLATDLKTGHDVAVKQLLPEYAFDALAIDRFLREARNAAKLDHPCICRVFGVYEDDDQQCIVMEYVIGQTLHNQMRHHPLLVSTALKYALDVSDALAAAHQIGIVHRDLKPSNIMINQAGRAVVVDFGLSKQLVDPFTPEAETVTALVKAPWIYGTIGYLSPEQIRHDSLDVRADIFSFGVLLYEMLTGTQPFKREDPLDTLQAIKHAEPLPPTRLRRQLNPRLDQIILKALRKQPEQRYRTIGEMRDEIKEVADSAPANERMNVVRNSARHRLIDGLVFARQRAAYVIACGAILLFVLGAAGLMRYRQKYYPLFSAPHYSPVFNWSRSAGENISGGKFSPDGKSIAFCSTGSDNHGIWVKGEGDPQQITSGQFDINPIWSPDGLRLAYVARIGSQVNISTISLENKNSSIVHTFESGSITPPALLAWRADSLYYEEASNVWRLSISTGQSARLTSFEAKNGYPKSFSVSPAEDKIAYSDADGEKHSIWVASINGQNPQRITNGNDDFSPIWDPADRAIYYTALRTGVLQVCLVVVNGGDERQVTVNSNDSQGLDISSDGRRILTESNRDEAAIWSVNLASGKELSLANNEGLKDFPQASSTGVLAYQVFNSWADLPHGRIFQRVLPNASHDSELIADGFRPLWSNDSSQIAFLRWRNRAAELWLTDSNGQNARLIAKRVDFNGYYPIPFHFSNDPVQWLPSSAGLLFLNRSDNGGALNFVSPNGAEQVISSSLIAQSETGSILASPDGRLIAYLAMPRRPIPDQPWRIGFVDRENGKATVLDQGGSPAHLVGWDNKDGLIIAIGADFLRYSTEPGDITLREVNIQTNRTRNLMSLPASYLEEICLSPDHQTVAFISREDSADNIWSISLRTGEKERLTSNVDPHTFISALAFSADGKQVFFDKQSSRSLFSSLENLF